MTYPYSNPTSGYTDDTLMRTEHAAVHNAIAAALLDIKSVMGDDPNGSFDTIQQYVGSVAAGVVDLQAAVAAIQAQLANNNLFSLASTPTSRSINTTSNTTYAISATVTLGSAQNVNLSIGGLPAGVTATWSSNPISSNGGTSTLTLTGSGSAAPGTYTLTIFGTGTYSVATTTITLTLTSAVANDFTLAISPSSNTVTPGGTCTYTVTATKTAGSAETATIAVSGVDIANVSGAASPGSISTDGGSTTVTITATGSASVAIAPSTGCLIGMHVGATSSGLAFANGLKAFESNDNTNAAYKNSTGANPFYVASDPLSPVGCYISYRYFNNDTWPLAEETAAAAAGKVLQIKLSNILAGTQASDLAAPSDPGTNWYNKGVHKLYKYTTITSGACDTFLTRVANGLKTLAGRHILSFCHEPDLNQGTPTTASVTMSTVTPYTITVAAYQNSDFPSSGTLYIPSLGTSVTYTGKSNSGGTFTGCLGGSGTLGSGVQVELHYNDPNFNSEAYDHNFSGTAAQFVSAFQYVKNYLTAQGVTNIEYAVIYSGWEADSAVSATWTKYSNLYPGDSYVSWVGWDPYAKGDGNLMTTKSKKFYDALEANMLGVGAKSKNYFLGEFGISAYSGRASELISLPAYWQSNMPKLKAALYYNSRTTGYLNDATSISGMRSLVNNAYMVRSVAATSDMFTVTATAPSATRTINATYQLVPGGSSPTVLLSTTVQNAGKLDMELPDYVSGSPRTNEVSGFAVCQAYSGWYWTHSDDGGDFVVRFKPQALGSTATSKPSNSPADAAKVTVTGFNYSSLEDMSEGPMLLEGGAPRRIIAFDTGNDGLGSYTYNLCIFPDTTGTTIQGYQVPFKFRQAGGGGTDRTPSVEAAVCDRSGIIWIIPKKDRGSYYGETDTSGSSRQDGTKGLSRIYKLDPLFVANTTLSASTAASAATFTVASTTAFPASGTFCGINTAGALQTITYTGKTSTTFTGCSGGSGTFASGARFFVTPLIAVDTGLDMQTTYDDAGTTRTVYPVSACMHPTLDIITVLYYDTRSGANQVRHEIRQFYRYAGETFAQALAKITDPGRQIFQMPNGGAAYGYAFSDREAIVWKPDGTGVYTGKDMNSIAGSPAAPIDFIATA